MGLHTRYEVPHSAFTNGRFRPEAATYLKGWSSIQCGSFFRSLKTCNGLTHCTINHAYSVEDENMLARALDSALSTAPSLLTLTTDNVVATTTIKTTNLMK